MGMEALPALTFVIFLELLLLWWSGKGFRLNDVISSTSQGLLYELSRLWTFGVETVVYIWIYDHFRVTSISPYMWRNWIFCAVAVDFGYYWIHRLMHEVRLFWAVHQVHHSSEEYNMTVALRLPILRPFLEWLTCLPLALIVPPTMFLVHYELQLLMQAWIHFGMIGKLGWLDYILNTPSNHRVHHGRNRRCIDRNFGGILMIWDHLFGTYEGEGDSKVVFGLTTPLQTLNPVHIQFHTFFHMWRKLLEVRGLGNKLSVVFKGPGWDVGKPRLGYFDEIPEDPDEPAFNPEIQRSKTAYVLLHFFLILKMFMDILNRRKTMEGARIVLGVTFVSYSTISFGFLLENRFPGEFLELLRCIFFLLLEVYLPTDWTSFTENATASTIMAEIVKTIFALSFLNSLLQLLLASPLRGTLCKLKAAIE